MAETTTHSKEMTRQEAAEFLRSIADELDSGRDAVEITVGNKGVKLSPPDTISTEATVTERSRRLRKDVEEMSLEFTWNPTKATAESDAESEAESETEAVGTETEPGTDAESEADR